MKGGHEWDLGPRPHVGPREPGTRPALSPLPAAHRRRRGQAKAEPAGEGEEGVGHLRRPGGPAAPTRFTETLL